MSFMKSLSCVLGYFLFRLRKSESRITVVYPPKAEGPGHSVTANMLALGARDSRFESECPECEKISLCHP